MNRYEAYKDSGVEWIGEIPAGWEVVPLKSVFVFGKGLPITKGNLTETGKPVISYGQIHSKNNNPAHIKPELIRFVPPSYAETNPESMTHKGDFLFADTSEDRAGSGNFVYHDCDDLILAGYHTLILRPVNSSYGRFLSYMFQDDGWRSQLRSRVGGVKLYSLTLKIFSSISILLPPLAGQQAIADFLDAKTAEIDGLVADCEREVELLQEYRKVVISEAVTKGLDPNTPMKDSGVEWIGEIPEGWRLIKLSHIASATLGKMLDSERQTGKCQARYLSNRNVQWFKIDSIDLKEMDFPLEARESFKILDGDLLVCEGGEVGRCAVWHGASPDFYFQKAIHRVRFDRNVMDPDFAAYQMFQKAQVTMLREVRKGESTIGHLPGDQLSRLMMLVPSLAEQREIVAYLDAKTAEIDSLIDSKRQMAEKLREYRKSLISEAVTGKFKVPGV